MKPDMTPISESYNTHITSGGNLPLWFSEDIAALAFTKLDHDVKTEVLVVGGGISGLTAAYCLAKEGKQVVLVEDGILGSGESGRTTAHITYALDDRYSELEKVFDEETSRLAAESHNAAIEWIEKTIRQHDIFCHFKRVNGYLFLHPSDTEDSLLKEHEATQRAGLPTEMLQQIPFIEGEEGKSCLRFPEQAQFHILLYLQGLAKAFAEAGGKIFTHTHAENITSKGADCNGFKVEAEHIVVATNTPVNDWATMHTKQWPYRSYVIGAKIQKGKLPYALWWDTGDMNSEWIEEPYHYVRLEEFDREYDVLIVGGEDHRTGQSGKEDITEKNRYDRLEEWTRKHFPQVTSIDFKWSGQVMEPLDHLGFIGRNPGDKNIYIITGDSGNGMTHGTLGGIIITDMIMERENPWIKVYDPSRITLNKTLDFLHEAGNMVAQYGDWLAPQDIEKVTQLQAGEGGVLASGLKKVAVFRDEQNHLHTCSAVCPHMGAILQWNPDEKTFDCPMHGSRFDGRGIVLNGPAMGNLSPFDEKKLR